MNAKLPTFHGLLQKALEREQALGGVELEAEKERFLTKCIRNWIGKGKSCSTILIVNLARIDFASDEYFIPFGSLGLPVVSIQLDLLEA